MNNWDMVGSEFAEIVARARRGMRGYTPPVEREAEYYCGMGAMVLRRFDEALDHFYRCDALSRTLDREEASGFMAMANLRDRNGVRYAGEAGSALAQYGRSGR